MPRKNKSSLDAYARKMTQALRLGHAHRLEKRAQATPPELAILLKMDSTSLPLVYLREAYIAGYYFTDHA